MASGKRGRPRAAENLAQRDFLSGLGAMAQKVFARYLISSCEEGVEVHRPVSQLGPLLPRDCGRVRRRRHHRLLARDPRFIWTRSGRFTLLRTRAGGSADAAVAGGSRMSLALALALAAAAGTAACAAGRLRRRGSVRLARGRGEGHAHYADHEDRDGPHDSCEEAIHAPPVGKQQWIHGSFRSSDTPGAITDTPFPAPPGWLLSDAWLAVELPDRPGGQSGGGAAAPPCDGGHAPVCAVAHTALTESPRSGYDCR